SQLRRHPRVAPDEPAVQLLRQRLGRLLSVNNLASPARGCRRRPLSFPPPPRRSVRPDDQTDAVRALSRRAAAPSLRRPGARACPPPADAPGPTIRPCPVSRARP